MDSFDVPLFELPAACVVDGCDRPVNRKRDGLCEPHYKRKWRHGDPLAGGPMRPDAKAGKKVRDFPDGTRICNECELRLPLEAFSVDRAGSQGRRSKCRTCHSAAVRDWYATNREQQAARQLERRRSNVEVARAWDRARYARDRDKRIALANEHAHRRRLRLLAGEYDVTVTRANLRKQYGDDCFYCSQLMDFRRYTHTTRPRNLATIEHVWPISKGGGHTWGNVVLACLACNLTKNALSFDEWQRGVLDGGEAAA